uniref:Uncharacterized protein n=1 Tax=mine drainage metagenome TaxID=410659 RepID=E6QL24_9ZZZZ
MVVAGKSEAGGTVGLRVAVDQENPESTHGEAGSEVDCGGSFSDAAFLVDDSENLAHGY